MLLPFFYSFSADNGSGGAISPGKVLLGIALVLAGTALNAVQVKNILILVREEEKVSAGKNFHIVSVFILRSF